MASLITTGFDLSRYDDEGPDGSDAVADPFAKFIIINAEDPRGGNKAHRAVDLGKPWTIYPWVYPGESGNAIVDRALRAADRWGAGRPTLGDFWADYEQGGVAPWQLAQARERRDRDGLIGGVYTYLYVLNGQGGMAQEWFAWDLRWIAYYPGGNTGARVDWAVGDAQRWDALWWQYTSSNGTRDRNIVVNDEEKHARLINPTAPAPAPPKPKRNNMELIIGPVYGGGRMSVLVDPAGDEVGRYTSQNIEGVDTAFGIPLSSVVPSGCTVTQFKQDDAAHVQAWVNVLTRLDARKKGASVSLTPEQVAAIAAAVDVQGQVIDAEQLARDVASHLTITTK